VPPQSQTKEPLAKLSFTPGFNRVVKSDVDTINRFNGFCSSFAEKTVETVNVFFQNLATRLKPGVNDRALPVALKLNSERLLL
jgi:hypothetical protein